ncbi:membrane protein insertase YidC [Spirochaetia bacterium]|nr:membrane protein insertase YidC [Spirochaetia bacterium]
MEKRTLLAVVLSITVMLVFYFVQGLFMPVPDPAAQTAAGQSAPVTAAPGPVPLPGLVPVTEAPVPAAGNATEVAGVETGLSAAANTPAVPLNEERVSIDTDLFTAVLSNVGGDLVSWKLKEHSDQNGSLEMIFSGDSEAHALTVAFGNQDAAPVSTLFNVKRIDDYTVEFFQDFVLPPGTGSYGGGTFRLTKRYSFKPSEYMFELTVSLDGGYSVSGFNFPGALGGSGAAYTLGFGPQIGPYFEKLDQRYEYRNYYSFINGKRKTEKVNNVLNNSRATWSAIAGKYFTFIAIPYLAQYDMVFSDKPEPGVPGASRLYIIRPSLNASRSEDVYRFYLGPKTQDALAVYNNGRNGFDIRDMQLIDVASGGPLAPLEKVLKWLLMIFQGIVHNYGVAIILLTLLVKVLLFPLTKKGSESTLKMQALAPKIKEIQDKYKEKPQEMNAKMAEFYKKEGYNPLSGCLPMLLQIPIFFAMYSLFNNHFDLRGAMFIPGWIPDLSLPESVYNFAPFRIPLLGWSDIRLLPFIYVGSQLLYGKVTQTPDQKSNAQMKMMLYAMPIVFFFVLYDVPSGLLLYWIMSNVLTMVQQLAINKYMAQKRAAMAAAGSDAAVKSGGTDGGGGKPVAAPKLPPKKKKKK